MEHWSTGASRIVPYVPMRLCAYVHMLPFAFHSLEWATSNPVTSGEIGVDAT